MTKRPAIFACPKCGRRFARRNQRHACGTGDDDVLRGRSPELIGLFQALKDFVRGLGPVELVARQRYVLLRSRRIFADLTVMTDCLRLVIHLPRRVERVAFEEVVADRRQVSHVVKLRSKVPLLPLLREAYEWSLVQGS